MCQLKLALYGYLIYLPQGKSSKIAANQMLGSKILVNETFNIFVINSVTCLIAHFGEANRESGPDYEIFPSMIPVYCLLTSI